MESISERQESNEDNLQFFFINVPGGSNGKESTCKVGDLDSGPWVGKISWRRAWQPTPVFLPGKSPWIEEPGGLQSLGSQRDMTEGLSHTHELYLGLAKW